MRIAVLAWNIASAKLHLAGHFAPIQRLVYAKHERRSITAQDPHMVTSRHTPESGLARTYECDVILCQEPEGGFSAHALQLAGVVSQGETQDEAVVNAIEAFKGALMSYLASGHPIPWRSDDPQFFDGMKVVGKRRIAVDA
jgi:predicted RNase H-like HicB family nuclease